MNRRSFLAAIGLAPVAAALFPSKSGEAHSLNLPRASVARRERGILTARHGSPRQVMNHDAQVWGREVEEIIRRYEIRRGRRR